MPLRGGGSRFVRSLGTAAVITLVDYALVLTGCVVAGRVLGEAALGAMNLLMPVFSFVAFFAWLLASGTSVVYSLATEKGDEERAAVLAWQGVVAAILLGFALVGVAWMLERPYLAFMAPSDEITGFSGAYWRWYLVVMVLKPVEIMLFYLALVRRGELVCIGAYLLLVTTNVVASYGLSLRLGMAGVAIGTVLAYAVSLTVMCAWTLSRRSDVAFKWGLDLGRLGRGIAAAFPESVVWLVQAALFVAIAKYILFFWGSESLAVCAVVFCIIRLTAFFGGIGLALRPLESSLRGGGSGQSEALMRTFRLGAAAAFAVMAFVAGLFFVAPELMIGLFGIESSDLVMGSKLAARITVFGLFLGTLAALLPLLRRVEKSKFREAPLNYLQNYVMARLAEAPSAQMFNLAKLFRLRKGLDLERLSAALVASGRSHAALATVLRRTADGDVVQRMELGPNDCTCPIVKIDEAELLAGRADLVKTFSVFGARLYEAKIFDCGERAYLLSNFHHLICDGYSFPLILNDARRAWNGETLAPDAYYEVLSRREERLRSPVVAAGRAYFREIVKSRTFTTLPPPDFRGAMGYGSQEAPLELPADFEDFLSAHRATRHHVFMAAAIVALARATGADDLLVDWVFHGRVSRDELRTVGAFMVDLPLVIEGISTMVPMDVIAQVKQGTFRGIKGGSSFRNVDDLNPTGQERLTFIYQDEWGELMTPGPVREDGPYAWMMEETIPLVAPSTTSENPFNVEIMEHRDATRLFVEYDACKYAESTIRRYIDLYRESLAWLLG